MNLFFRAALFATASVFAFAATGLFQQRLAHYSVITVLGFRLMVGAACIAAYMFFFERLFFERRNTRISASVWNYPIFRSWVGMFAAIVVLYGLAFIGRSLADVCTIVGFMPIFVILIDVFYHKKNFPRRNWVPVYLMFLATLSPTVYQLYKGHMASVLSWATYLALLGAASHAAWVLTNRSVHTCFGPEGNSNRVFQMFFAAGVILLVLSNMDVAHEVEEKFRQPGFQQRFLTIASGWDFLNLFFAGLCSALSVLAIAEALAIDDPKRVALYQYSLPIWGTILAFVPAAPRPEFTTDVHLVLGLASLVVIVGAILLYFFDKKQ